MSENEQTLTTPESAESPGTPSKSVPWTEVEALKGTRFGALIQQYRDLEVEEADIKDRKERLRAEIQPFVEKLDHSVRVQDRVAGYTPPSTTERLDRSRLIRAGVTPDQIKAGLVKTPKKGFLWIRSVKESIGSPSTTEQST